MFFGYLFNYRTFLDGQIGPTAIWRFHDELWPAALRLALPFDTWRQV